MQNNFNKDRVIDELKHRYPGKKIVVNDENNTTEIICEVEPATENSAKSVSVVVIDEKIEHVHPNTTELYEVLKGELVVSNPNGDRKLRAGESIAIHPGEKHTTEGHGTWIKVTSTPGWSDKDHIKVKE